LSSFSAVAMTEVTAAGRRSGCRFYRTPPAAPGPAVPAPRRL
jgi:hypothetical protein